MTRKQALHKTIELLSNNPDNSEIIEKLQECIDELPFTKWSEKAIFDACDQFICEHNRVPSARDFDCGGMPSHSVIRNRFGLTVTEFRSKYYPNEIIKYKSPHWRKSDEEWIKSFVKEYNRIKPTSATQYDKLKDKNNPTWITISKMAGVKNWIELKNLLELETYKKPRYIKPSDFEISISAPSLDKLKELSK